MKKIEKLAPSTVAESIKKRIEDLEKYVENHKENFSVDGHIRISQSHGNTQYYYVKTNSKPNGIYVSKTQIEFVRKIAQKEFDVQFDKQVSLEKECLSNMLIEYQKKQTSTCITKMSAEKQKLITSPTLSDDEYKKIWSSIIFNGKKIDKNGAEFTTLNGLRVRSKSEIIIAQALEDAGVPFRYEYPVKLDITVYPDFYCLNLRTRQEFIWEHLGKLDDSEYIIQNIKKFREYSKHGFLMGKNLIVTYETAESPLPTSEILQKIKEFLL